MKDRAVTSSAADHLLPSYHFHHDPYSHHDHRFNRKPQGGEDVWRDMPMRGAEVNLLANSLTSRLRKAARQRATTSSAGTTTTTSATTSAATTTSNSASRSAQQDESGRKFSRSSSKGESRPAQGRPSILKRSLSREAAERQYRYLMDQSRDSPYDDHRLPDVLADCRLSASTGHLDEVGMEVEGYNNQYLDRASPTLALFRGGGGGGGGGSSRGHMSNGGQIMWVKRAGIFQPLDKYAPGRQTLHGDDQPFSHSLPVDYETVTLPSRPGSGESYGGASGRSSGKGLGRKKGLKVSWKDSGSSEGHQQGDSRAAEETASSARLRSAGTVYSEATSAYSKPRFNSGKSRVPCIGVKWKVPMPKVGRLATAAGGSSHGGDGGGAAAEGLSLSSSESSGYSSPASMQSLTSPAPQFPPPSKPSPNARDLRHPWRALYPRDVHPVTTAMEREGTSVSKTKWHVPGTRKVPAYTFIEDLLESRCYQWNPAVMQRGRLTTRATVDAQSLQVRMAEEEARGSNATSTSASTGLSDGTNHAADVPFTGVGDQ